MVVVWLFFVCLLARNRKKLLYGNILPAVFVVVCVLLGGLFFCFKKNKLIYNVKYSNQRNDLKTNLTHFNYTYVTPSVWLMTLEKKTTLPCDEQPFQLTATWTVLNSSII